jgi:large subunit ribosomal protein L33
MAKKGENRIIIQLACSDCKERIYTTTKNKKNDTQRLELSKYCPRCRAHKVYREVR